MKKIIITLDSTSDMNPEIMEKFDLTYIPMGVSIEDKIYPASLTWDDFSMEEFYQMMKDGKRVFTVAINTEEFKSYFTKWLDEGCDIIYIGCSSGLSASVKNARTVASELAPLYPEQKIFVIDPLMSGLGQAQFGIRGSELRSEGKSAEEIYNALLEDVLHINQAATVGDLTYLKRAGRVKAGKAFFGNLFGVKPILVTNIKGQNVAASKAKGRQGSLEAIVDLTMKKTANDPTRYVTISHADCLEDALKLKEMLIERGMVCKDYIIGKLGPILGGSCGPNTLKVDTYGEKVTLEEE